MVFVGRVTGMVDCRWADPKTGTVDYAYVPLGRKYALASGLMEITYDTGAKVILQGPCVYKVESATGGYLSHGKVTALVEKKSGRRKAERRKQPDTQIVQRSNSPDFPHSAFPIRTPTALVTDLGTEFGVEVDKRRHDRVARFPRQGRTDGVGGRREARARQDHAYGQRVGASRQGTGQPNACRCAGTRSIAASFVRSEQFAVKAKEIGELPLRPFRGWQAASERLRKRDDLLAYYDFQRDPDHPRDESGYELLRNRAASGAQVRRPRPRGAIRMGMAQGRFPGKDALRFAYPGDGVRINIPGEFPQLTLWRRSRWSDADGLSGILMTDKWDRGGPLPLAVLRDGGHQVRQPRAPSSIFWLKRAKRPTFARGTFGAVVYDAPGRRMTTYVDGRRWQEWTVTNGTEL